MRLFPLVALFLLLASPLGAEEFAIAYLDKDQNPVVGDEAPAFERRIDVGGAFVDLNPQGVTIREGSLIDGEKSGLVVEYYPDGARRAHKHYLNGSKQGRWRWWYPGGQLRLEGHWRSEGSEAGQFVVESVWDPSGEPLTVDGEGEYQSRFPSGEPKILGQYHQGRRDGEWTYFDEAGTVRYRELYEAGTFIVGWRILDGMSIRFTEVRTEARPPQSWSEFWAQRPASSGDGHGPVPAILLELTPEGRLVWLEAPEAGLDAATRQAWLHWLAQAPRWTPATVRGAPVRTLLSLKRLAPERLLQP